MGEAHERDDAELRPLADGRGDLGDRLADRDDDADVETAGESSGNLSVSFELDLGFVIVACFGLSVLPAIIQAMRWW